MFYAVLALLATRKRETSKHGGAISLFDKEFVKPGTFTKDFSRWLHDAFDLRQRADYVRDFKVTREEAEETLEDGTKTAFMGSANETYLINLDLPGNPTRLEQRKGRIQRIGQLRDIVFHR